MIGFVTMYSAFWQQDFTVVFGTMLLFMEVSTPFVCLRWLMFAHGVTGGNVIQSTNSFLLFFSFLGGRVFWQIYACLFVGVPWLWDMYFVNENVPTGYLALLAWMQLAVAINVILNFYWAFLITKQVYRIITCGGKSDSDFVEGSADGKPRETGDEEACPAKHDGLEMAPVLD